MQVARIAEEGRGDSAMAIAEGQLWPDETVTWAGYPNPMALARRDASKSWVGIQITAVAIFFTWRVSRTIEHTSSPFQLYIHLCSLMFFAIGLSTLLQPLRSALKARSTVYAITNRRALIISGTRSRSVDWFDPADLANLECKQRRDGSGDIILHRTITTAWRSRSSRRSDLMPAVGFFGVPEVRRVEEALGELAASAKAS